MADIDAEDRHQVQRTWEFQRHPLAAKSVTPDGAR
jgi:hypothetical protein